MPLGTLIALVAGFPALVILGLAAGGWLALMPAIAAGTLTVAVGVGVVLVWRHEVELVRQAIASADGEGGFDPASLTMEALSFEVGRLTRRLASRAALEAQHRRADAQILDRLPDPVVVLAVDRTIRRMNTAARISFGDDIPAVLRQPDLRAALDRGSVQTVALSLRAPVAREVQATVVPMDPPLADGGRTLVVLSDRTREHAVERMRADFVANVSHELRTPLTSVVGFIETLQGPAADDPEAQRKFLAIMAEQGSRMKRLIDDLLSLSRIELNEHQPPLERLDLSEAVPRFAAGLQPRFAERAVTLDMQIAGDLPDIAADADQIAQVLQNLLDNAVKYGRDGGTVHLTVARAEPGDRWPSRPGVVIAVADEGSGIAKEHLPRLTERFYRVDKGRSRAVGGTGLGLAIVKHIVNRHRGQMLIESELGKGTAISIWLPLTQSSAPVPA